MPTGYTAGVCDGTVTSFRQFALQCARAFGACVEMRDDPMDKPIPDELVVDTGYYDERIATARATLAETYDPARAEREAVEHYEANCALWNKHRQNREASRANYRAMLAKVTAWQPPTSQHVELRSFMLKQLEESLRFDTDYEAPVPARLSSEAWWTAREENAREQLDYYTREREKVIARTAERNRWIKDLRASLPED